MDIAIALACVLGKPFTRKLPTPQLGEACRLPVPSVTTPGCDEPRELATNPTVRGAGAAISRQQSFRAVALTTDLEPARLTLQ